MRAGKNDLLLTQRIEKLEIINPEEKSLKDHAQEFSTLIEELKDLHA